MYCYTLLCVFFAECRRHFPCYPCFRMKTVWYIRTANDIERRVREGSRPLVSM